jgi:hypothetical protein
MTLERNVFVTNMPVCSATGELVGNCNCGYHAQMNNARPMVNGEDEFDADMIPPPVVELVANERRKEHRDNLITNFGQTSKDPYVTGGQTRGRQPLRSSDSLHDDYLKAIGSHERPASSAPQYDASMEHEEGEEPYTTEPKDPEAEIDEERKRRLGLCVDPEFESDLHKPRTMAEIIGRQASHGRVQNPFNPQFPVEPPNVP